MTNSTSSKFSQVQSNINPPSDTASRISVDDNTWSDTTSDKSNLRSSLQMNASDTTTREPSYTVDNNSGPSEAGRTPRAVSTPSTPPTGTETPLRGSHLNLQQIARASILQQYVLEPPRDGGPTYGLIYQTELMQVHKGTMQNAAD